ncbi:outer membrane beta-barrel protein [Pelagibacterium halotolerans]|uniref:outer membrane beta-barrel protein n=1 Tax=Pelagibacterium halotolerans TaxID=531813 RepID=UPI00384C3E80
MSIASIVYRALLVTGAAGFAVPGAFAQGDGSGTDNLDLLRTGYGSDFCEPAMLCHTAREGAEGSSVTVQASGQAPTPQPVQPAPAMPPRPAFAPQPALSDPAPRFSEPVPLFDTELSVTLRGSYAVEDGDSSYAASVTPGAQFSYARDDLAADLRLSAGLVYVGDEAVEVEDGVAEFNLTRNFGSTRRLGLQAALAVGQEDPTGLDADADVETEPLRVSGNVDATLSQDFARANVTVSGGVLRETVSPTTLSDGTIVYNDAENLTAISGGVRLGYALTPIVGVFAAADVEREDFDAVSDDLGASRNGWNYALRGGFSGNWSDVVTLEASIGAGRRTFDDAALSTVDTVLYGAALGFNPDATTQLRLSFDTRIAPGTDGASATVNYALALEGDYTVNSWLGLRGSASALWQEAADSDAVIRTYQAGIGADVALGANTTLALDYGYGLKEDSEADPQISDEHRVSAGVTLRY